MSETANYGLYLTDGAKESFFEWREKISGKNNSNMQKIDKALSEKANRSIPIFATLLANNWDGADAPYTQTLVIPGLTSEDNGLFDIAHSATATQRDIARYALLSIIAQENETLTFVADGELPEQDIPICIVIFG